MQNVVFYKLGQIIEVNSAPSTAIVCRLTILKNHYTKLLTYDQQQYDIEFNWNNLTDTFLISYDTKMLLRGTAEILNVQPRTQPQLPTRISSFLSPSHISPCISVFGSRTPRQIVHVPPIPWL